ncbi:hypothetical protein EG346_16915 [Chryseobacterium carnipullorum]|uniref:Uncharacterized protein n=1 Tax=Chryseobacterium carnipullorum TaxID=1124835 RepID=A0A376DVJ5_CHRCU|nr:DUF6706 family protein [Chryseobacterium carnipullorum]AZA49758.1 hypothetical protein EG346_16915 [Chryseobacterium carnipullorum]AZA64649.1 hypothetical protein EG345_07940 [Chryseobacterium carnipullorum]STC95597.1 Uncharacterised protein [Chryseobacterium carnipullorum]
MTIGEYIQEKFSNWSVEYSDGMVAAELARVNLDPSDTITNDINLDTFFYNIFPDIILLPKSVSEGGFSISYDKDAITAYYKILASRLGLPNLLAKDTITDITHKW